MEPNTNANINKNYTQSKLPQQFDDRDNWRVMFQKLYADMGELFRKEGQLVRTEFQEKTVELKEATVSAISAGVVLFVGLQLVAATAVILLNLVTSLWLAVSIVTIVFLIAGGVMIATAKKKFASSSLKPTKSIEAFDHIRFSVKEKFNEITKH